MVLLGPAPAVAIGVISTIAESIVTRVTVRQAFVNILVFAFLGLVGGLLFDALRAWLGLERRDTAYALLVMPTYVALATLNLGLVTVYHPASAAASCETRRACRAARAPERTHGGRHGPRVGRTQAGRCGTARRAGDHDPLVRSGAAALD